MNCQNLYSKGFPTNRIPIKLPSSGKSIILRETTVTELKSMAKTIIDNFGRRQMDVIYDAVSDYLQAMILCGDPVDVRKDMTEFDRLYCLMVFFQVSFFKDPVNFTCPHCGVEVVYRYDMSKYLAKMEGAYVDDQTTTTRSRSKDYTFTMGWPSVATMSSLMRYFYSELGTVTEEMERTQFGLDFVLSFIKKVSVTNAISGQVEAEVDLTSLDVFSDRLDCLNALPSIVMFDDKEGAFNKVMGFFVNRLENCFGPEICPQCHKETDYGLPQSSVFHSLFYGSMKSLYGFVLQVEVLCLFRYGCLIFDKEEDMTYNDLSTLMHQLSITEEKDQKERQKMGKDGLGKGLWYIREILNTMVFPQDKFKK